MVSCVDTCFAMEPARALRLKGYAVMFGSAVQYTSNIGVLYGFVTGDITYIGVYMGAFCGCMVAMNVVAANLASAALAKVPDKEENRQLRRRLRSLRKGAVMAGAPIAFMGLCFCVAIFVVPAVSRQAGVMSSATSYGNRGIRSGAGHRAWPDRSSPAPLPSPAARSRRSCRRSRAPAVGVRP